MTTFAAAQMRYLVDSEHSQPRPLTHFLVLDRLKRFVVSLLISAIMSLSAAPPPIDVTVEQLTGSEYKVWTETAIDVTLGQSDACTAGCEYVFAANFTGVLRECRNQRIIEKPFSWTHRSDGIDDFISFNDHEYRLIISAGTDPRSGLEYEEAVLRIETVRSQPTTDIILRHIP